MKKKGVKTEYEKLIGGCVFHSPEARPQRVSAVAGTQAQGSRGHGVTRTCLLPRDSSHGVNWFVHSAEKPSSRSNWLRKQVSAFPLKSDDFHSLTAVTAFRDLCHQGYRKAALHSIAAHKLCMPTLFSSPTSMQLTGDGVCACALKQSIRS